MMRVITLQVTLSGIAYIGGNMSADAIRDEFGVDAEEQEDAVEVTVVSDTKE